MSRVVAKTLPVRIRAGLGLFATREARRFAFAFEGLLVRSWRRVDELAWADVRAARVAVVGRRIRLHLTFEGGRLVRVPLASYHGSARLLQDIERRLPVAIAASESVKARLEALDTA